MANKNSQNGISIAKRCRDYARENHGDTPASLSEAFSSVGETEEVLERRRYLDPDTMEHLDWLYFPLNDLAEGDEDRLFLAAPRAFSKERVVVFADCSSRIMKEAEFQALLRKAVQ